MCGKRTHSTGLNRILNQSSGAKAPFSITYPTGTCIQLLLAMIQKAESVVPNATIAVEKQIEPGRDARAAEQQDPEKARLEKKGGEGLVGEQWALDRSGHPRQHAPVRAELERHDDPGDDAEPERDAEDLEPELEHLTVDRTPGPQMQSPRAR